MTRWTYLIPRLIILGLIALAIWVGSDPLIRRIVVNNLQNSTGAKVEIGHLRTSMNKRQVLIKDLVIASPRDPMKNLLQADMAYIELDTKSLLNGQLIIERGQTSQAVFGAPRTNSGALDESVPLTFETPNWHPKTFEPVERLGLSWLDQLPVPSQTEPTFTSSAIADAASGLDQFWAKELSNQASNVEALHARTAELSRLVNSSSPNPLRRDQVDSTSVHKEISTASNLIAEQIYELKQTLQTQRAAIQTAYNEDFQKISVANPGSKFDGDSISQLLLAKTEEQNINEIINWFYWFRKTVPDPRVDFLPKSKRGLNLKIPIANKKPGILIKSIDIEGEGRFANHHTKFAGTAYNLTSQPQLHDQPASFELRAQGDQHVRVECVLDRRGNQSVDSLNITCPGLEVRQPQLLGEPNSMQVTMAPRSRLQADIKIHAIDDQLTGEIVFRRSNVALHVDKLNILAGGDNAALKINQGLAELNQFESKILISGSFDDYSYELKSDLGNRFSNAVSDVLSFKAQLAVDNQKKTLDQLLKFQLHKLDSEIAPQLLKLENSLSEEATVIADLRSLLPKSNSRLPRIR